MHVVQHWQHLLDVDKGSRHATGTVIGGGGGRSAIAGNPLGEPLGNFVPPVSAAEAWRSNGSCKLLSCIAAAIARTGCK